MKYYASGDRASWLNTVAAKIMDGGTFPPSIERLNIIVPPEIVTKENDGHVTAAAALGEEARKDFRAGWRIIIQEMIMLLREQGFVGGSDQGLTWIKPLSGEWKIAMPDDVQITVYGQRERRMVRDRAVVGERSEGAGDRVGVPSLFQTGRMAPLELQVVGSRGATKQQSFELHPLALAIPPMTEAERETLRASIERDGVKVPIEIYQKKILDGRNRAYFASVLRKPVHIKEFTGTEDEARRHVAILNLHRRHLNASQRGIAAINLFGEQATKDATESYQKAISRPRQSRPIIGATIRGKKEDRWEGRVARLANEVGLNVTPSTIQAMREVMEAPETMANAVAGKFQYVKDAHSAARREKNQPVSLIPVEAKPKSINDRLGMCIDNLNKILIDCEMQPGNAMPRLISERLTQIEMLVGHVRAALRARKLIS